MIIAGTSPFSQGFLSRAGRWDTGWERRCQRGWASGDWHRAELAGSPSAARQALCKRCVFCLRHGTGRPVSLRASSGAAERSDGWRGAAPGRSCGAQTVGHLLRATQQHGVSFQLAGNRRDLSFGFAEVRSSLPAATVPEPVAAATAPFGGKGTRREFGFCCFVAQN